PAAPCRRLTVTRANLYSARMIVCPVCEHQQALGDVCETCGKQLVEPKPMNVARETLPDLETTAIAASDANVLDVRMAELELHASAAVTVAPEKMADIELTRVAEDAARTPPPQVLTCRYCGGSQQKGTLCDTCGMKLPTFRPAQQTAAAAAADSAVVPCPACGIKGPTNKTCQACGAFIRRPEL
ncbi:MAG: hypothetical protein ACK4N5_21705, partial [Myxococcales bacterium]